MSCQEFLESYDLLIDQETGRGGLSRGELDALLAHRRECESCRRECEEGARLGARLQALPSLEPPEPAHVPADPPRRPLRSLLTWLPGVAAAALVIAALLGWPRPGNSPAVKRSALSNASQLLREGKTQLGLETVSQQVAALTGRKDARWGDALWDWYHLQGDVEGLLDAVEATELAYATRLAGGALTPVERSVIVDDADLLGFRRGYALFAQGLYSDAQNAFTKHILDLNTKQARGETLSEAARITRDFRSQDMVELLTKIVGKPAPRDFDLGDGWISVDPPRLATLKGSCVAIVFRSIGDLRAAAFLGPLSKFCAGQPGMRMLTFTWLNERDSLETQKGRLESELKSFGVSCAAGVDPDAQRQSFFRAFEATVGTATFYVLNPRGEISWVMRDPRGIDVEMAESLLRRTLQTRADPEPRKTSQRPARSPSTVR